MKKSSKAIAVQQRHLNDFLTVSDGDAEGIIPPICALGMNWGNAERKSEVLLTDCPQATTCEKPGAPTRQLLYRRLGPLGLTLSGGERPVP